MSSIDNSQTKVNNERPESSFKLPSAKFDADPSPTHTHTSRTKSPISMNKQCNAQGSIKYLNRSYDRESMDGEMDCIVANLYLEDMINNGNT